MGLSADGSCIYGIYRSILEIGKDSASLSKVCGILSCWARLMYRFINNTENGWSG